MINLFSAISKMTRSPNSDGIGETLLRILHSLKLISVLHTFDFVYNELEGSKDFISSKIENIHETNGVPLECREINANELEQLNYTDGMYSIETLQKHFGNGMRFFGAFCKNTLVAVRGVHTSYAQLAYINRPLVRLPHGVVYMNCALTAPTYRNAKVGSVLRSYMLNQIRKEGYQAVVGAVFVDNRAALRWNLRNGFKRWGRVSYIKCIERNFWWTRLTKVGRQHPYLLNDVVTETSAKEPVVEAV